MTQYHIKAFTADPNQGNPAGVIFYEQGELTDKEMLQIAKEFGYSESAFVHHIDENQFRIRFFSPTTEVDMCGHASIAAAYAINMHFFDSTEDKILLNANRKDVVVSELNAKYYLNLGEASIVDGEYDEEIIASLLEISSDMIIGEIQLIDSGSKKLMIPLKDFSVLEKIRPNFEAMIKFCESSEVRGFYPFSRSDAEDLYLARQFNPYAGINEDPVTGVAGAGLLKYLNEMDANIRSIRIEQGHFVGMKGEMHVKFGDGDDVLVGGESVGFE